MWMLLALACVSSDKPEAASVADSGLSTSTPAVAPGDPEFLFSFAVIADPHVSGPGEHADRLAAAVAWVNDNRAARGVELTLVCGDIGWGDGLAEARDALDLLDVPYAPITGDNEIHIGDESAFHEVFAGALDTLAADMDGFVKAPLPTNDPELGREVWLQNYAFGHRGVRFLALDWASRSDDFVEGEMGTLHPFAGGTLEFFETQLASAADRPPESIVLGSHIPMLMAPGAFDVFEIAELDALTQPVADRVAASFAGHWHVDHEGPDQAGGYDAYIIDATWDDEVVLWVVDVAFDGVGYHYDHERVVVPW